MLPFMIAQLAVFDSTILFDSVIPYAFKRKDFTVVLLSQASRKLLFVRSHEMCDIYPGTRMQ